MHMDALLRLLLSERDRDDDRLEPARLVPGKSNVAHKVAGAATPPPDAAPLDWAAALTASRGLGAAPQALPFHDRIQASFGAHDVSGIHAHVGGAAATAAADLGADAYAFGNHVAFASTPDLHTAAHEAAHVIQQRAGVGSPDSVHERQADAVADLVVAGASAESLLGSPSHASATSMVVQRKERGAAAASCPTIPPERHFAINNLRDQIASTFDAMEVGLQNVVLNLIAPKEAPRDRWAAIISGVLKVALLGVDHFVGEEAARVVENVIGGIKSLAATTSRGLVRAVGDGALATVSRGENSPVAAFATEMQERIALARASVTDYYWHQVAPILVQIEEAHVHRLAQAFQSSGYRGRIQQRFRQACTVAWTNFLAQLHNGAEQGTANIESQRASWLTDPKRQDFDDTHGILVIEIERTRIDGLKGMATRLHGLSVHGIPDALKTDLRRFGTVRTVPMNKLIRVYRYHHQTPPYGEITVLITADGSVQRTHKSWEWRSTSEEEVQAYIDAANDTEMRFLR
jgi:hypothetical protein